MSAEIAASNKAGRDAAHAMYIVYAVALFTGFPMFIGVLIAYLSRGNAGRVMRSHFSHGIVTFWWTLIIGAIGVILTIVVIGWAIIGLVWLWSAYRILRGWVRLFDERPAPGYEV